MSYQLSDFDDWNWDDAPIGGESTNESLISQGVGWLTDNVKEIAVAKAWWNGDFGQDPSSTMGTAGYNQAQMLGTVEKPQNVNGGLVDPTNSGINPLWIGAGLLGLGLVALAVAK